MCSLGFVKFFVKLGARLTILIGLAVLVFGCFVLIKTNGKNYANLYYNDADWLKTLQEYGFIILGVVIIIMGACGTSGVSQKSQSCRGFLLFIYELSSIILTVLLIFLTIFTFYYAETAFSGDCKNTDWFKQIDDGVQQAEQLFCSAQCPCGINISQFTDQSVLKGKFIEQNDINKVQKCASFEVQKYGPSAALMEAAEELFTCSGWCTNTSLYLFSDVNRGNTNKKNCFDNVGDFITSTGEYLGYILLGLSILFGLNVIFVLMLCCSPDNKKKSNNVYVRMQGFE